MNKPVAIVRKYTISGIDNFHVEIRTKLKEGTALYTHPVKELTKELDALLCSVLGEAYLGEEKEQALAKEIRAILRKAQE